LGGGEVRLLDLTGAFGVFATGGVHVQPTLILEVRNALGQLIYEQTTAMGERVLDERVAFLITDILSDNAARAPTFGFNSVLQIGRPAAVKTGTTQDYRDNWTVGYTSELAVGVWVGNADNSPMVNLSGVSGAGPIWHDFMREALAGKPESAFVVPPGLTRAEVCVPSGLLPTPLCPRTRTEWFIEGTTPAQADTLYQHVEIDARTGQPADAATPPEARVAQVALVLPPAAREWAIQAGIPQLVAGQVASSEWQVRIASPDPQTIYQISPRLPRENQRVPFRIISAYPISTVTFLLNDESAGTANASPFEFWWPLEPGSFQLKARVLLANGETVETESVGFVVNP
ncbi:MAG: penicillin-binding transpeptidase domain-containing protein, partial [Anaerolineales bacterium]